MSIDLNTILKEVELQLHKIGSANDAEDHQYTEEAGRMRTEASASLHSLLDQNSVLNSILPCLLTELDTGHIFGFGWSVLLEKIDNYRKDNSPSLA